MEHIESKLGIYTVIGYPDKQSSQQILAFLSDSPKVGFIELGFPFSDPVADGPVIQMAHAQSLLNGTKLKDLFDSAKFVKSSMAKNNRSKTIIAMGYLNQVLQYGMKKFLCDCGDSGISHIIIPDMPPEAYQLHYKDLFLESSVSPVFLFTPNCTDQRIIQIDKYSNEYVYAVSGLSITGVNSENDFDSRRKYISRITKLKLKNKIIFGFGIKNTNEVAQVIDAGLFPVVGSAFISCLQDCDLIENNVKNFLDKII